MVCTFDISMLKDLQYLFEFSCFIVYVPLEKLVRFHEFCNLWDFLKREKYIKFKREKNVSLQFAMM